MVLVCDNRIKFVCINSQAEALLIFNSTKGTSYSRCFHFKHLMWILCKLQILFPSDALSPLPRPVYRMPHNTEYWRNKSAFTFLDIFLVRFMELVNFDADSALNVIRRLV